MCPVLHPPENARHSHFIGTELTPWCRVTHGELPGSKGEPPQNVAALRLNHGFLLHSPTHSLASGGANQCKQNVFAVCACPAPHIENSQSTYQLCETSASISFKVLHAFLSLNQNKDCRRGYQTVSCSHGGISVSPEDQESTGSLRMCKARWPRLSLEPTPRALFRKPQRCQV